MTDEGSEIPSVVKADVGRLPDGSIALRLTYSATEKAAGARDWEETVFLLGPETARELGARLLGSSDDTPAPVTRSARL